MTTAARTRRRCELSSSLTSIRMNPVYMRRQRRMEVPRDLPLVGPQAEKGLDASKAAVRVHPATTFFETARCPLRRPGRRPRRPHARPAMRNATEFDGPIVIHVLTQKGRGYPPARTTTRSTSTTPRCSTWRSGHRRLPIGYTQAFSEAIIKEAEHESRLVAITRPCRDRRACSRSRSGSRPVLRRRHRRAARRHRGRRHGHGRAAPVVAIYSTFLNRAWDQVVYDVALHRLPVLFAVDRAGITGDDGASHHGVYDIALLSRVPGMTVLAPSRRRSCSRCSTTPSSCSSRPVAIRYPKGQAHQVPDDDVGRGPGAEDAGGDGRVCILAVGKLVANAGRGAAAGGRIEVTIWDVRCCAPLDDDDRRRGPARARRHLRRRDPGRRRRHDDRGPRPPRLRDRPPPHVEVLGVPTRFIPRPSPTASWPRSASTPTASRRRSVAC